jgi:uncharacterized protein
MALPLSRAALVRVVPFAAFMVLLAVRGAVPEDGSWGIDPRWLYGVTVLAVGGLLAWFWREYGELVSQTLPSLTEAALAVAVGLVVFGLWINLDAPWMRLGEPSAGFVPKDANGQLLWPLIAVRWVGASLLVPVMEELFWRSFLMRWVQSPQFESVVPQQVGLKAVVLSTFVFMLAHTLWLAAIVAGLAYAWLYVRTGKLWVPIIAHAVTNGVLGVWVLQTQRWAFW